MLSYQHGFHAGNRADVLKHAVLDTLLRTAAAGPKPVLYVETHAGRGVYDLTSPQAVKGGEARTGVLPFMDSDAPEALASWLDLVRARGDEAYPGSPALAQARLNQASRLVLFERHPQEHAALLESMTGDCRVQIRHADGYAGALTLLPRAGEQVMVFIDPSYETRRDIEALAHWAPSALKRWPHGLIVIWLPLFRDGRETEICEYLLTLADGFLVNARWPVSPENRSSLEGSAMLAFGLPREARRGLSLIGRTLQSLWKAGG